MTTFYRVYKVQAYRGISGLTFNVPLGNYLVMANNALEAETIVKAQRIADGLDYGGVKYRSRYFGTTIIGSNDPILIETRMTAAQWATKESEASDE